jgi:hypothetical protein
MCRRCPPVNHRREGQYETQISVLEPFRKTPIFAKQKSQIHMNTYYHVVVYR